MRCSHCGFPLAPKRTSCPRCGTASRSAGLASSPNQAPTSPPTSFVPVGTQNNLGQHTWGTSGPANAPGIQGPSFGQQIPFPAQGQKDMPMGNPPAFSPMQTPQAQSQVQPGSAPLSTPVPIANMAWASQSYLNTPPTRQEMPMPVTSAPLPRPTGQNTRKRAMPLGFTVAGLCVITGGLILAFVYIMSIGLATPPTSNMPTLSTTTHITKKNTAVTIPTPTHPVSTTPNVTPTPPTTAFPGQQYIDQAQMASAIDPNTALPTMLTNTFKVNQRINVTFKLHPSNQGGEVCLDWFLNSQPLFQFHFSVQPTTPLAAYSYAIIPNPGSAYVDISWASSAACTDKMLAQQVNFTVTP